MSWATTAGRSRPQESSRAASRCPCPASETSCPGCLSEVPKPSRSNTYTVKRSESSHATRRHDHDDHGVPCTSTTGGPCPKRSQATSPAPVAKRSRSIHSFTEARYPSPPTTEGVTEKDHFPAHP